LNVYHTVLRCEKVLEPLLINMAALLIIYGGLLTENLYIPLGCGAGVALGSGAWVVCPGTGAKVVIGWGARVTLPPVTWPVGRVG